LYLLHTFYRWAGRDASTPFDQHHPRTHVDGTMFAQLFCCRSVGNDPHTALPGSCLSLKFANPK
jgi:hypothetical protein